MMSTPYFACNLKMTWSDSKNKSKDKFKLAMIYKNIEIRN